VAKTHGMPYLYRSFSAKSPIISGSFAGNEVCISLVATVFNVLVGVYMYMSLPQIWMCKRFFGCVHVYDSSADVWVCKRVWVCECLCL